LIFRPLNSNLFRAGLAALILLGANLAALALSPALELTQFVHEQWQSDKGLPDNTIRGIAQTLDGYLWLATETGLVRFDGMVFKLFDRDNTPAFKDSFIQKIAVATNGVLWVGTRNGGLLSYENGKFSRFQFKSGDSPKITALYASPDGLIWVGTRNNQIYSNQNERLIEYGWHSNLDDYPLSFFQDSHKSLWIGMASGAVACIDDSKLEICRVPPLPFSKSVQGFVEDKTGTIWIGTGGQGLYQFESGKYVQRGLQPDKPGQTVESLAVDREGSVWVGTQSYGLVRYAQGKFTTLFPQGSDAFRHVLCIFEDRDGNLWFGTYSRGLHRLRQGAFTSLSRSEGFLSDSIWSIYQDRKDRLLLSTANEGLAIIENGTLETYVCTNAPGIRATAMHEYPSGEFCLGSSRYGVMRSTDPRSENWQPIPGFEGEIFSICEDTAQRLWVGTAGHGLHCLDGTNHTVFTAENGLPDNSIRAVIDDRRGGLWIGTQHSGVSHYNGITFTNYGINAGLSDPAVRALLLDRSGLLWAGTREGGLNCLSNGRFYVLNKENGLFHNSINNVLEDEQGNIWIGTPNGVGRIPRSQIDDFISGKSTSVRARMFSELDGIRNPECTGRYFPSAIKTRNGELWFGTTRGISKISPSEFFPVQQGPATVVEELIIDDRVLPPENTPQLPPGTTRVQFAYSAPSFLNAPRLRFEHKLKGLDKNWVAAGTLRQAVYTQLGPGNYTFQVRARSDDSDWTAVPATFAFAIGAPFYRTVPFYASSGIALILLLRIAYLVRMRQSRQREKILERNVEIKTRQLLDEILIRRKAEDALRELPQRIMHAQEGERRRVARELHDGVNQTLATIRLRLFKLEANLNPEQQQEARRACKLLEMARTEVTRISQNLRPSELDDLGLVPAFRSTAEGFSRHTQIQLEFTHENLPEQIPAGIQDNLYRIMQEALNNIEKHAYASLVQIRLVYRDKAIRLTICDNGRGFSDSARNESKSTGAGWGLVNMRERASSQGGSFNLESAPSFGTEISVSIPLLNDTVSPTLISYVQP
jgi:signal transduction histidine kinase/ligand-binding sensor domain-containing protein